MHLRQLWLNGRKSAILPTPPPSGAPIVGDPNGISPGHKKLESIGNQVVALLEHSL